MIIFFLELWKEWGIIFLESYESFGGCYEKDFFVGFGFNFEFLDFGV